jgi:site-specific recombinase XerD
MTQSDNSKSKSLSLAQLVADAMVQLEQLGYSRRTQRRYRRIWEHLIEFASKEKLGDSFSENLLGRYLEAYRVGDGEADKPGQRWRRHIVFVLKVLRDFAHNRRIERSRANAKSIQLLPAMERVFRDYVQYCKDRLFLRGSSLEGRTRELKLFMDFLRLQNVETLDQIQVVNLSEYVSSRGHQKPKSVSRIVSDIRSFLRFLTMRGITQKDLSQELPKIRIPKDAHIPSVWDPELIEKLLRVIDRSSTKGKRDYAILLMACRLGLRVGDIRTLRLDHIKWEDSRIEIMQSKTNTPLILPLPEEIGQALIDYLKSGRPKTRHREVFLKMHPPFEPFSRANMYHIVTHWRRMAGITFRAQHHRGMHSLRHSLATRLLQEGTSIQTISAILGHATSESTRIYAKADVEALRGVALDPEEVSHGK